MNGRVPPGQTHEITDRLHFDTTLKKTFVNDHYDPNNSDPSQRDRNLIVDRLEIAGPFDVVVDNPQRDRLIDCDVAQGAACVQGVVERFARRDQLLDPLPRLV